MTGETNRDTNSARDRRLFVIAMTDSRFHPEFNYYNYNNNYNYYNTYRSGVISLRRIRNLPETTRRVGLSNVLQTTYLRGKIIFKKYVQVVTVIVHLLTTD